MLPQLFLDRMKQMLEEEYPAFLNSYEDARYQALRINPSKTDRNRFAEETSFHLQPVPWEANGVFITKRKISRENIRITRRACTIFRSRVPWHRLHIWDAQPGEKVLDLCAAPGGKSTQIAAAMQGKGLLSAMRFIRRGQRFFREHGTDGCKKCDGDKRESADTCGNVYGIF